MRPRTVAVAAIVLALVAAGVVYWGGRQPAPTTSPTPQAPHQSAPASAAQSSPARPDPSPSITLGQVRRPDARLSGQPVWIAPGPQQESRLTRALGPLPETIDLNQTYPPLKPAVMTRATAAFTIYDDASSPVRLLVLDEGGQLFELGGATPVQGAGTKVRLTAAGDRLVFDNQGDVATINLDSLTVVTVSEAPGRGREARPAVPAELRFRGWRGPGDAASGRTARVADTSGIRGVQTTSDRPQAVVVDGKRPAVLVLDGRRPPYCCEVAGWVSPHQVLVESHAGDQLRLLVWDVRTGRVGLASTIAPALGPGVSLATSYARLDR